MSLSLCLGPRFPAHFFFSSHLLQAASGIVPLSAYLSSPGLLQGRDSLSWTRLQVTYVSTSAALSAEL